MLLLNASVDKELYLIYGLVALVIILIIVIIILDRIENKKAKKNINRLSDTLQMKPITEEMVEDYDKRNNTNNEISSIDEVKIDLSNIPDYKEEEIEKTQAQIRVEEITNALKEAGVDEEENINYDKYDSFEQEQEKNAIISYEQLMNSYDKLYEENEKNQYRDDDTIPINIDELYELSEQEKNFVDNTLKDEKIVIEEPKIETLEDNNTFKNSPYISPVYGIQKPYNEIKNDEEIASANNFLNNLKELKSNLE